MEIKIMISSYEAQYMNIVQNILKKGYYDNNRTVTPTYKLPHQIIQVDLQKEFPILRSKQVAFKTATKEMLWIFKDQSNDVKKLQEQGVHIWDEWVNSEGTIGEAYGWIVKQYNQIDKLINGLKNNPQDRRLMINLWQIPHLDKGTLAPCCFNSMWDVTDGQLNCMLIQRSGDIPLGVPFNTTQYAVLTHLLAQVVGLQVGQLTHVINNAHIYENQIKGMEEQVKRYEQLRHCVYNYYSFNKYHNNVTEKEYNNLRGIYKLEPKLKLNTNINNFYDFTIDDIVLENYKNLGKIKMEVSV
jgi:thymidylate synthase